MFRLVHKNHLKTLKPLALLMVGLFGTVTSAWADGPPQESSISNPVVVTLIIVMMILLLVIGLLSNVLLGAAEYLRDKEKTESKSISIPAAVITGVLMLLAGSAVAQDVPSTASAVSTQSIPGISDTAFYFMVSVIALEVTVVLFMLGQLKSLLAKTRLKVFERRPEVREAKSKTSFAKMWSKANSFRPIQEEAELDLNHDYDGIRELNNRLPPWWLYGFYITIIFAGVYLWRYHVAYSAPLSGEEFQIAMKQADLENAEYLKKSANNVDENTVKFSTESTVLEAGKKIYVGSCAPCHGADGQGVVGPNLTDNYWLHGGSISDVFKSIKYGWPDKGMKSWKEDFSPNQLSELTSYIQSLKGTNPANAKEAQGTLETEQVPAIDSTAKSVASN